MKTTIFFFSTFLLAFSLLFGQQLHPATALTMPFLEKESDFIPLAEYQNKSFEDALRQRISKNRKWQSLVAGKKMAVGLVDLSDEANPRFACINCDDMMYAASLPKIAILLAAVQAFEDGTLEETKEIKKDLRLMISYSDNRASTRMIDRLTFEKIESVLRDSQHELYDEERGGGLWVGKRYASQGRRYPEPMKGLSHAATVRQICRFYYLMHKGQLVNEQRSAQMKDIMVNPDLRHKFVNTLAMIAPQAKLYRKSGSWRTYHSDSVLVLGPKRKYILAALVDDPGGESIMRKLVNEVDYLLQPTKKTS